MNNNFRKSAGKAAFTTLGITTVLCCVIFWFMTKTGAELKMMTVDVALTAALTGLITAVLMSLTSKKAALKPDAAVLDYEQLDGQACYLLVHKSFLGYILGATIADFILFGLAPLGFLYAFFPAVNMPRFGYVVFKALVAGCAAAFAAYHANIMGISLLKRKYSSDAA